MKVLVCGGRDFTDVELVYKALDKIIGLQMLCPTIISGMATGADSIALMYADERFYMIEKYPADWKQYGKRAGYIRNKQMLDEGKPDLVVAFPGGKGTTMMIDLAIKAGIKVKGVCRHQQTGKIVMGTLGASTQMGVKGSSSQTEISAPTIQTKRYMDMYLQRISELGHTTPGQKAGIYMEFLDQEKKWLISMDYEYNEIMQIQEAFGNGNSGD